MSRKNRLSKDEYYLGIAESVCARSPCIRRQFGSIIVREDVVVSSGYNGPARGVINCLEVGCLKDELSIPSYKGYEHCNGVHAEENAVINAARHGSCILNGALYLYGRDYMTGETFEGKPCNRCRRILINAGIKEVVTKNKEEEVIKKEVGKWVSKDTENYLRELEKARKH